MCFCDMCFFCANCNKRKYVINKPDGMRDAPDRILCMACGYIERGVYVAEANGCSICFIPCPCSCNQGDPSLACGRCLTTFRNMSLDRCQGCGVYSSIAAKYCANCGDHLQSGQSGRVDTEESDGMNGNSENPKKRNGNSEDASKEHGNSENPDKKHGKTVREMNDDK